VIAVENRKLPSSSVYLTPHTEGVPLGIGYRCKGSKTRMMGLIGGEKGFKIGLTV